MTADEDIELVALIDNQLDEDAKQRLLDRLVSDSALQARYDTLKVARGRIIEAFDTLLQRAPLSQLRAKLPRDNVLSVSQRFVRGIALRELAAGLFVGLITAGLTAWAITGHAPNEEREDWRSAVVEYMELYTNETFAIEDQNRSFQAKTLSALGEKLGLNLTPERLVLPDLAFRSAQLLSYDGAPLGEIVYVDARNAPVLFCIIGDREPDTQLQVERRGDFSMASWSREGKAYLVIGRLPEQSIAQTAQALAQRLSKT